MLKTDLNQRKSRGQGAKDLPVGIYKIYQGLEGLEKIKERWERLLPRVDDLCFTHFPGWFVAYMKYLAVDPERFYFVGVETKSDRLIAIFPFELREISFFLFKYRILCLPKHPEVRMVDFVMDSSHLRPEEIFVNVLDWLRKELPFQWDAVFLPGVFSRGIAAKCVKEQTKYPTFTGACFNCNIIPVIDYQYLEKKISKNFRHNLKKARNKLKKEKEVRFRRVSDPEDLFDIFEKFVELESSGWKGEKGTAIKCQKGVKEYYAQLIRSFSRIGGAEIAYLEIEDQLVVALYILKIRDTAYFYKIGYDETKGYLSPGNLLIEWLLKTYYVEGKIKYINLITDAAYMKKWVPEVEEMCNYFCFERSLKGIFVRSVLRVFFNSKRSGVYKKFKKFIFKHNMLAA